MTKKCLKIWRNSWIFVYYFNLLIQLFISTMFLTGMFLVLAVMSSPAFKGLVKLGAGGAETQIRD